MTEPKQPRSPRYLVRIAVQAMDMLTGRSISGHTSDVSLAGCYIETQQPLDTESSIRIQFSHMGSKATVFGDVVRVDADGMAIRFRGTTTDQLAELKKWLFAGDR
jgi:PilZ domain